MAILSSYKKEEAIPFLLVAMLLSYKKEEQKEVIMFGGYTFKLSNDGASR